jgi:hypothetical protein
MKLAEKELIFKRKISVSPNGQARISLPRPIAEALGSCGQVGLIWRGGSCVIAPWPQETPA